MKMTNEANGYAYQNDPALSDKWKFRFDFFQKHGVSELWGATPEFKSAVKALDFAQRIKINVNFYAVFFPFIYFFYNWVVAPGRNCARHGSGIGHHRRHTGLA